MHCLLFNNHLTTIQHFVYYFLGGRIDLAHHANRPQLALTEAVQLSEAVAKLDDITKEGIF